MIHIDNPVKEKMIADALSAFPDECCGFLFGEEREGGMRAMTDMIIAGNAKEGDRRRRFEITPQDYLKAERHAEEQGLTLLGVYHSHPDHPAVPSEHDRVAAQPFFSYVILAVRRDEFVALRFWQLNDVCQFEEEKILTTDTIHPV